MPTTTRLLTDADLPALIDLLADDGGYTERVNGRPSVPEDARALLAERPPTAHPDQKRTLGLFEDEALVGVADTMSDWPEPGTTYLGLLQIRGSRQGQGLGRLLHDALLELEPGARTWRLTVVDTNIEATGFWERLGYRRTGEVKPWTSPTGLPHDAVVMELRTGRQSCGR